jgi:hypothetical protein
LYPNPAAATITAAIAPPISHDLLAPEVELVGVDSPAENIGPPKTAECDFREAEEKTGSPESDGCSKSGETRGEIPAASSEWIDSAETCSEKS